MRQFSLLMPGCGDFHGIGDAIQCRCDVQGGDVTHPPEWRRWCSAQGVIWWTRMRWDHRVAAERAARPPAWPVASAPAGPCLAIGAGGLLLTPHPVAQTAPPEAPPGVPVTVASATRQDFPVYLAGLGQVQAFNAVLVRARVDGTLMQFVPTEGQEVKQGDLIAVIDPRPYKAALDAGGGEARAGRRPTWPMRGWTWRATPRWPSRTLPPASRSIRRPRWSTRPVAAIAGDDAAIESAKLNLSFCYITSPIDGRVGLRQVDPGNLVHATDASRHRDDHPDPSDRGHLHPAAGGSAARHSAAHGATRQACRCWPMPATTGRGSTAATLLTPDNAIDPTHRHDQAEGDVPERRPTSSGPASSSTRGCWWPPCTTR